MSSSQQESLAEDSRETVSAVMVLGWIVGLFGFLVLFFHPAAAKIGERRFEIAAIIMIVGGLLINTVARFVRSRMS